MNFSLFSQFALFNSLRIFRFYFNNVFLFLLLTNSFFISFVFDWVIYFVLLLSLFLHESFDGLRECCNCHLLNWHTTRGRSNCVVLCVHVVFVFHSSSTVQCWFNLIENNVREKRTASDFTWKCVVSACYAFSLCMRVDMNCCSWVVKK